MSLDKEAPRLLLKKGHLTNWLHRIHFNVLSYPGTQETAADIIQGSLVTLSSKTDLSVVHVM